MIREYGASQHELEVDDGIATGATFYASLAALRNMHLNMHLRRRTPTPEPPLPPDPSPFPGPPLPEPTPTPEPPPPPDPSPFPGPPPSYETRETALYWTSPQANDPV